MPRRLLLLPAFALIAAPALAQESPPASSQTLAALLNIHVISQVHRSVQFERTLPQLVALASPPVEDPQMLRVADAVYIDRALTPRAAPVEEEGAIRVLPADAR